MHCGSNRPTGKSAARYLYTPAADRMYPDKIRKMLISLILHADRNCSNPKRGQRAARRSLAYARVTIERLFVAARTI